MDGKEKTKQRLKGLFHSKEKVKDPVQSDADLHSFLHGPSDKLNFPAPTPASPASPASPPRLTKIDTNSARRWPTASELQNVKGARGRATTSPPRRNKGLSVRFTDARPVIIGEGGEEAEEPTISLRNRANTHPFVGKSEPTSNQPSAAHREDFRPMQIRRTQTGFDSIPDVGSVAAQPMGDLEGIEDSRARKRSSILFAERVKADMRAGEGKVLVQATSNMSKAVDAQFQRALSPVPTAGATDNDLDEVQINTMKNLHVAVPSSIPAELIPGHSLPWRGPQQSGSTMGSMENDSNHNSRSSTATTLDTPASVSRISSAKSSIAIFENPQQISRSTTATLHGATIALGDEALEQFRKRVAHLLTLFRLSSEAIHPLSQYTFEEFIRVAVWWFLRGRIALESTIRDRPASPQAQQSNFLVRQQAYADLAKCLWIIESVVPEYHDLSRHQKSSDPNLHDLVEIQRALMSSLRKLTMSMKRNNFLPPEDAPLTQGLDPSIWLPDEGNQSLLASQKHVGPMSVPDSMPLGDSSRYFQYARMFAKGFLSEEGESQPYLCPVLASLVRETEERSLSMMVSNQHGTFKLCIQIDRSRGPTWDDTTWHPQSNTLDVKLPRGFTFRMQCSQADFRVFWGLYDYEKKMHASMKLRRDERLIFDTSLKSLQYIDPAGTAGFPKEPVARCQLKAFEKVLVEKAATGARTMHRGYRISIITHRSNKTLRGVNQELSPNLPIQFDFLRGDGGSPGMLIAINDSDSKYKLLLTFNDARDRLEFHDRLTGASNSGETVVTETTISSVRIDSHQTDEKGTSCLKGLSWQNVQVINQEGEGQQSASPVLSDNLRMLLGFGIGKFTDRLNLGQGEMQIRLGISALDELTMLRQPQQDMTCSVLESKASKQLPQDLAELLDVIAKSVTTRTYTFPGPKELHGFQEAVTGYSVAFDGIASSFNISRRRMVVPIYKKWEAMTTRLQIVKRDTQTQLLAFFENFHHGGCMNFVLKSTDFFEISGKSGKWALRIVDAKFALPKGHGDADAGIEKEFVCLDSPEYPSEHDDITIVFEQEAAPPLIGLSANPSVSYRR
ncbi:hypothetical protein B0O99DRAFT_679669 [Bisporella sp. PMI_857]|nr:hypothetical protein B0O99DRAFT_679669 [Bisporella sp. PMI_857]